MFELNEEEVQEVIDEVRPQLQADGGDVELKEVTDEGVVKVKLVGACAGCPMSTMTISKGIEKALKDELPEVEKVESV